MYIYLLLLYVEKTAALLSVVGSAGGSISGDTDIVEDPNDAVSFFRHGNTKEFVAISFDIIQNPERPR
jgi:hypothetical protein